MTANIALSVHVFRCVFLLFWLSWPLAQAYDPIEINKTPPAPSPKIHICYSCAGHVRITFACRFYYITFNLVGSRPRARTTARRQIIMTANTVLSVHVFLCVFLLFWLSRPLAQAYNPIKINKTPPSPTNKYKTLFVAPDTHE